MSKMDDLRAMREARFGQAANDPAPRAERPASPAAAKRAQLAAAPRPESSDAADADAVDAVEEQLCGHRAISGRSCTREHGHSEKSHRYS